MSTIRVVRGTGSGPTELAAYDAALANAGLHDYNLVRLSSVIPAGPHLEVVGTAPDLGPTGGKLHVVESAARAAPGESVAAGVGWARAADRGPGVFYEVEGEDPEAVHAEIETGLDAGVDLREWAPASESTVVERVSADGDAHAACVVAAAFGEARPLP